jgi:hypothetical protein
VETEVLLPVYDRLFGANARIPGGLLQTTSSSRTWQSGELKKDYFARSENPVDVGSWLLVDLQSKLLTANNPRHALSNRAHGFVWKPERRRSCVIRLKIPETVNVLSRDIWITVNAAELFRI